jgi:hypothetical protein
MLSADANIVALPPPLFEALLLYVNVSFERRSYMGISPRGS